MCPVCGPICKILSVIEKKEDKQYQKNNKQYENNNIKEEQSGKEEKKIDDKEDIKINNN